FAIQVRRRRGIIRLVHRLGLFFHRRAEAQLVGAGAGDELVERGGLSFPAEFANAAIGEDTRPTDGDVSEIARQLAGSAYGNSSGAIARDCLFRYAVDPTGAKEGRGIDMVKNHGIEIPDHDRTIVHDSNTA